MRPTRWISSQLADQQLLTKRMDCPYAGAEP